MEDKCLRKIVEFDDETIMEQGFGRYDNTCLFLSAPEKEIYAPKDLDAYKFFYKMSKRFLCDDIYDDYLKIKKLTKRKEIGHDRAMNEIKKISMSYNEHSIAFQIWLTFFYLKAKSECSNSNLSMRSKLRDFVMFQILQDGVRIEKALIFDNEREYYEVMEQLKTMNLQWN